MKIWQPVLRVNEFPTKLYVRLRLVSGNTETCSSSKSSCVNMSICTRLSLLGHQPAPKYWHGDFLWVVNARPSLGLFLASSSKLNWLVSFYLSFALGIFVSFLLSLFLQFGWWLLGFLPPPQISHSLPPSSFILPFPKFLLLFILFAWQTRLSFLCLTIGHSALY